MLVTPAVGFPAILLLLALARGVCAVDQDAGGIGVNGAVLDVGIDRRTMGIEWIVLDVYTRDVRTQDGHTVEYR